MKSIRYLRIKNTAKLEKLIKENAPYKKILKQSQIVDEYINLEIKLMNINNNEDELVVNS